MSYRALYRVWRSQRFEDLVGQEHVTKTLQNALREGHISHAYLFSGPRGTGKTSAARILAKAVNCERGPAAEPCNECETCRRITEGGIMDVVEIDAASNRGVDEIRDLRDKVKYAPTEVRYKVYIIDEVHMLTTEAFNALLKTLEEPPAHVLFILATTEPHKLPPTILSRCQRFAFRRIAFEKIINHLRMICDDQQVRYEESALIAVAQAADGGMRDALSLLDQAFAFGGEQLDEQTVLAVTGSVSRDVIFQLLGAMAEENVTAALSQLDECVTNGLEPEKLIQDLMHACRDLLLCKAAPNLDEVQVQLTSSRQMKEVAERCSSARLTSMLDLLVHYQQQMKQVAHPRILLEMAVVRLCQPPAEERVERGVTDTSSEVQELRRRVQALEQMVEKLKSAPVVNVVQQGEADVAEQAIISAERAPKLRATKGTTSTMSPKLMGQEWIRQLSEERLAEVRRTWADILRQVKKEKVTVHAWVVGGEPVGATEDTVILAFKSQIHRDTTDRAGNKELVEKVMEKTLGRPVQLFSLMVSEWEEIQSYAEKNASGASPEPTPVKEEVDIVKKAIEIFGSDAVEVCE